MTNIGFQSSNIEANLDYNEEEARKEGNDDSPDNDIPGVQQQFVEKIVERLKKECSYRSKDDIECWLLHHLNQNDWWVRIVHIKTITRKLGFKLNLDHAAYYRDIYIWLPDIRWSDEVKSEMMPCCPNCLTNARVGPHC